MRYIFLLYGDETASPAFGSPEWDALMPKYEAFGKELERRGLTNEGEPLHDTVTASTVRVRDGVASTSDGPFAETKEQLGGYYLIDCKDAAEARELAAMIPAAASGCVEVRPVLEMG